MTSVSAARIRLFGCVVCVSLALQGCGGGGGSSPSGPPTITGTTFSGAEDSVLSGRVTLTDPDGGALQVNVTAQPTEGTLTGPDTNGSFSYSPRANFYGSDAFSISVTDSQGLSATATVALSIASVNDQPTAGGDSAVTAPASAVTIPVLSNDSDIEAQQLQPRIATQSPHGDAQVQPDGSVTFTPALGFAGETQFQYQAVDTEGGASAAVTVGVNVRPLKSAVYYMAESIDPRLVLTSPSSTRRLTTTLASGATIDDLQVSANGHTAMWQVRTPLGSSPDPWYYIDLRAENASARSLGSSEYNRPYKLSPAGTHVLIPQSPIVGFLISTTVRIHTLSGGGDQMIPTDPATEQAAYFWFSPDGESVVYRTNAPTQFDTDVSYYRVATSDPASPTRLAHSFATDQGGYNVKVTPDGSRVVFDGHVNNWAYPVLRSTRADGSSNAQTIGPLLTNPDFAIRDFEIAPTSRHVAFTNQSVMTPPQHAVSSYIIDLETGGSAQIGTGFTTSHRVTQPTFSRDGTKFALGISSGTEAAIYEASVDNPAALTRVSSVHESRVNLSQVRYAANDRIVYAGDVRQSGVYEIFVAKDGQSQRLNADFGTTVAANGTGLRFALSSDGTTLAYAQPATSAAPHDLYLIDVTTPELPLRIGEDVSMGIYYNLAYAILD